MRVYVRGPRIAGLRTGVGVGPEDFRERRGSRSRAGADPRADGSFVYVISDGHRVKIGSSNDPSRRIRELQTGNPRKLSFTFVGVTPGPGYDIELKAQDIVAAQRAPGGDDWFDTSAELAAAAVMGAAAQLGERLHAVSPNQVDKIVQMAGSDETGKRPGRVSRGTIYVLMFSVAAALSWFALSAGLPAMIIGIAVALIIMLTICEKMMD